MAGSILNGAKLTEWVQSIRFDFDGPSVFLNSLASFLAEVPTGVIVAAAAVAVAALASTRKPGAATLLVLTALGALGAVGWVL